MRRSFYSLLSIIIVFYACSQTISSPKIQLSSLGSIRLIDNYIFELVYANDSILLASTLESPQMMLKIPLDGDDDSHAKAFLNPGRGPTDASQTILYEVAYDTLHILSYSPAGIEKIIKIPLKQIDNVSAWKISDCSTALRGVQVSSGFTVSKAGDYYVVGDHLGVPNILSKIDASGRTYQPMDFWPKDSYPFNSNPIVKQMVYMRGAKLFCNGTNLLYVCGDGQYAIIGNESDGHHFVPRIEVLNKMPKYAGASDGMSVRRDPKGEIGLYSYASYKDVLLSPILARIKGGKYVPNSYKGYPAYYSDVLVKYDWNGTECGSYTLDYPFCCLILDESGEKIYTLSLDIQTGDQVIEIYDMPSDCE